MKLVVLGNRLRRDDGLGPALLDRLGAEVEGVELGDDLLGLLDHLDGPVVLVDAVAGQEPGRIHRWHGSPPDGMSRCLSSHGIGLQQVLALARTTGHRFELVVYGVEGADFGWGEGLSEPVQAAVERLLEQLRQGR